MPENFFQTLVLLLLVTDPFGNVPLFTSTLAGVAPERRARVIVRECLIAFFLLLTFMFVGRHFLGALQLTDVSLRIGGGVILFLIALRMVFPQPGGVFGTEHLGHEPLIVPLAIPALAGPSALVTVLLFSSSQKMPMTLYVIALMLVAVVWLLVLLSAERLQRVLGPAVMTAFERLMGLILTALAIEMLLAGIRDYVLALKVGG